MKVIHNNAWRTVVQPENKADAVILAASIAQRFFHLLDWATANGGVRIYTGTTANSIVLREVASATGLMAHEAWEIVEIIGNAHFDNPSADSWFLQLVEAVPEGGDVFDLRWGIRTVVRAAARECLASYRPAARKPLP